MSETVEPKLIAQAAAGDREALTQLLEAHSMGLRARLARRIGARWGAMLEVDDVLQVTFLEAFLRIECFQGDDPISFEAWLRRIAENNLLDAVRVLDRDKRPPPDKRVAARKDNGTVSSVELMDVLQTSGRTPSRRAAAEEAHAAVREAIDRLPTDYACVLRLADLQSVEVAQVAATMNRSIGAVYMLRARAIEHLREMLGRESRFFSDKA